MTGAEPWLTPQGTPTTHHQRFPMASSQSTPLWWTGNDSYTMYTALIAMALNIAVAVLANLVLIKGHSRH